MSRQASSALAGAWPVPSSAPMKPELQVATNAAPSRVSVWRAAMAAP